MLIFIVFLLFIFIFLKANRENTNPCSRDEVLIYGECRTVRVGYVGGHSDKDSDRHSERYSERHLNRHSDRHSDRHADRYNY